MIRSNNSLAMALPFRTQFAALSTLEHERAFGPRGAAWLQSPERFSRHARAVTGGAWDSAPLVQGVSGAPLADCTQIPAYPALARISLCR